MFGIHLKQRLPPPSWRAPGAGGLHNLPFGFRREHKHNLLRVVGKRQPHGFGGLLPQAGTPAIVRVPPHRCQPVFSTHEISPPSQTPSREHQSSMERSLL